MTGKMKFKLLLEKEYLEKYSDETRPVGAEELIDMLNRHGINIERKSIYADAKLLKEFGIKLKFVRNPSSGYYITERLFSLNEIRFLIDTLKASASISQRTTDILIDKIGTLCSESRMDIIRDRNYVDSSRKTKNNETLDSLEAINEAIKKGKKLEFSYTRKIIDREGKAIRNYSKHYSVSPYALVVSDDHYYLIAYNPNHESLSHFRIDKMKAVVVAKEKAVPHRQVTKYKGEFDAEDYVSTIFHMFSSNDVETVEILCSTDIVDPVSEHIGSNAKLIAVDKDNFIAKFDAPITDGLCSWIFEYGKKMKVLAPQKLSDMVIERANDVLARYRETL